MNLGLENPKTDLRLLWLLATLVIHATPAEMWLTLCDFCDSSSAGSLISSIQQLHTQSLVGPININALWLISQFYHNHPGAPHCICAIHFASMNFHAGLPTPWFCRSQVNASLKRGWCKENSQIPSFQLCNSCDTLWFLRLCNHPPEKLHQVAAPIDHSVHVTYCLSLPHCSPFYFCALLLPSYSISILFHILFPILSVFHILLLSLFCDPLLVAMHSVPYVVPLCLGSP